MKRRRAFLFSLALLGLSAGPLLPVRADETPDYLRKEPTVHDRIYAFEHRILPAWVHQSEGAFYADLEQGHHEQLTETATKLGGSDFAAGIKIRRIDEPAGFLITFPAPQTMPECYFAAVLKDGGQYRYVTLELTEDLFNDGTKTCLCEWSRDGSHLNFGPRKFADEASFLAELKDRAGQKAAPKPAASFFPPKS
ncbi:MAG TPA: hypothetical protein VMI53_06325 [Opitutaceae bacterium]|nr:hypothetical protein [Opitutaceae bacterium]